MGNATPNYTNLQSKSTPKTNFFSKKHTFPNFYPQNTHSVPKLPHTAHHVKPEIKNTPRSAGGLRSAIRGRHASNLRATSTVLRLTSNCLLHDRTLILTHCSHRVNQKKSQIFPNNTFFTEFHRKKSLIRNRGLPTGETGVRPILLS